MSVCEECVAYCCCHAPFNPIVKVDTNTFI